MILKLQCFTVYWRYTVNFTVLGSWVQWFRYQSQGHFLRKKNPPTVEGICRSSFRLDLSLWCSRSTSGKSKKHGDFFWGLFDCFLPSSSNHMYRKWFLIPIEGINSTKEVTNSQSIHKRGHLASKQNDPSIFCTLLKTIKWTTNILPQGGFVYDIWNSPWYTCHLPLWVTFVFHQHRPREAGRTGACCQWGRPCHPVSLASSMVKNVQIYRSHFPHQWAVEGLHPPRLT